MPSITYDKFAGLDRRKSASVSDPNRLRQLTNAFITTAKAVRKRPGLTHVATLEAGTVGLFGANGKLNTFYGLGAIAHANSLFQANKVADPTGTLAVSAVHDAEVFNGYLYVAIEYSDASVYHHYLDGSSPTHVQDANCPHHKVLTKAQSKIWSPKDDVVRFCATGDPRDWTTAEDAGFLPVGLQHSGEATTTALGQHQRDLIVFFADGAQSWVVDPDPTLHVLRTTLEGIGTVYPRSVRRVNDDVFFLGHDGYRSFSVQAATQNLSDTDVGSPIDDLVFPRLVGGINPVSTYYSGAGQYWDLLGDTVDVFSFSRTEKISAWSQYVFGASPDAFALLSGNLYLRFGDEVYRVDKSSYTDGGTEFTVTVELPFLDFKSPGYIKYIESMDIVIQGDAEIQFRWDSRTPEFMTDPIQVSGDSRPGERIPVNITTNAIAPVITATHAGEFQLESITFYYNVLGPL